MKYERWFSRATACLAVVIAAGLFAGRCMASDKNPDCLSKVDQSKVLEGVKQVEAPLKGTPSYANRMNMTCMFVNDDEPPKSVNEQAEMDRAADKDGMMGCYLWLGRHYPMPKGYKAPKGMQGKETLESSEERINTCRGFALQVMAEQKLHRDECKHPENFASEGPNVLPQLKGNETSSGEMGGVTGRTAGATPVEDSSNTAQSDKGNTKRKLKAVGESLGHILNF